ncbi:MAG: hypothetical protein BMS9Abin29_0789 [Gemmatimonadota bacterium]|nr:MAG: hypothetical protein BMS9Abin29_0789 [Gemmatimonadota bacterium]
MGYLVRPWWDLFTAFVGTNLLQSSFTRWCLMESIEEARHVIGEFIERYNRGWLPERHGYRTPPQIREEFIRKAA